MPIPEDRMVGSIHTATAGRDVLFNDPDGWEVDAPWLWFEGDSPRNPLAGSTIGNPIKGAEAGMSSYLSYALPVVDRCLQLTADRVASMPWKVYRGRERIEAPHWITDPQGMERDGRRLWVGGGMDVRFSAVEFWSQYLRSLLLDGEGIAYTPRVLDDDGEPTGPIVSPCYVLNPRHVEVVKGRYAVPDDEAEDGWSYLDPRELIVTRWNVRAGHKRGLGILQAHLFDLAAARNLRQYADNLLQRGVPNGYLKSSKPDMDQAKADELKANWVRAHGGIEKSIAVLNATTEFIPITINPQAMQYVEMAKLSDFGICHIFGIPPSKLGISIGTSLQYATLESANAEYVQDALMSIARRMEAALDAALPHGHASKIDFNQLLRSDTNQRYEAYRVGIQSGFLTVDEVRALEDLPPLPKDAARDLLKPDLGQPLDPQVPVFGDETGLDSDVRQTKLEAVA